ncbi:MAG TPA: hypothetical protein VHC20_05220 [Candidatus Paceibacterota bacterium]|nr:hypothetical protein [Candidatus Paceibacterota bacterium]
MNATVIALNASLPTCSARTKSDILIVFKPPAGALIDLDDVLDVDLLALDRVQVVENLTKRQRVAVEVRSRDIHDLRLPSAHGTSRFPSDERRKEA